VHILAYICIFSAYFLHIFCIFSAYLCIFCAYFYIFMHIFCIFSAYFLHIFCIFCAYFVHISTYSCIFYAYLLHICCIYFASFLHIICIFGAYFSIFLHILCILLTGIAAGPRARRPRPYLSVRSVARHSPGPPDTPDGARSLRFRDSSRKQIIKNLMMSERAPDSDITEEVDGRAESTTVHSTRL
jgi:hypothetical protein